MRPQFQLEALRHLETVLRHRTTPLDGRAGRVRTDQGRPRSPEKGTGRLLNGMMTHRNQGGKKSFARNGKCSVPLPTAAAACTCMRLERRPPPLRMQALRRQIKSIGSSIRGYIIYIPDRRPEVNARLTNRAPFPSVVQKVTR
jgi:hypothetical protein